MEKSHRSSVVLRSKRNNGNIRLAGTGGQAHGTSRKILERSRDILFSNRRR